MIDLKLDDNGDLAIESGDLVLVSGIDQIKQNLKIRLRTFYGEWLFDTTRGIKFFEEIFVKQPNLSIVDSLIKQQVIETTDVTEIIEYSSEVNIVIRHLTVSLTVRTAFGDTTLLEELP